MDPGKLLNLRKFLVPEIVYGPGAIALSGRHAGNLGASKVFIVTDPGVRAAGWTVKVEESLAEYDIQYTVFDGITPNPRDHEVMNGADVCRRHGCDLIIAVGGGSPMDCAKGIGVMMGNPGSILDYEGVDMIPNPGPPLIFIPTTAGTSADVSQFSIITDTRRGVKIAVISKMVIPDIALIDPATTLTMSPELTAATGMDALCHSVEAFVSTASSPLTDMAALASVRIIFEYLLKAYQHPGNLEYRDRMMTASLMAGLAFSNASLGLVHAMAHSLGGARDLPHGLCNALLLEKVIFYNYPSSPEKYHQLASAMGVDTGPAHSSGCGSDISHAVAMLRKQLNITQRLTDFGITDADIPKLSAFAFNDPCLATNPKNTGTGDIESLYRQIL